MLESRTQEVRAFESNVKSFENMGEHPSVHLTYAVVIDEEKATHAVCARIRE